MSKLLKTDLFGLVQNLPHFKQEALLPVFEAVVNSIQSIFQSKINNGIVKIKIIRDQQLNLKFEKDNPEYKAPIVGFDIIDNGIGFTEKNIESFKTSYSTHKIEFGCKGIGRFVWLKAFENVEIYSTFYQNNNLKSKKIIFNINKGIVEKEIFTRKEVETIVKLIGFKEDYRECHTAYKKGETIARRIFEHCLSYYVAEKCPSIIVVDGKDIFELDSFYSQIKDEQVVDTITINNIDFKIAHLKLYSSQIGMHNVVLCGNSRAVCTDKISNFIGVNAEFDEGNNKFIYSVYVTSDYLDKNVDNIRLDFLFPKKNDFTAKLYEKEYPVTKDQIICEVIKKTKEFLKKYLDIIEEQKQKLVHDYVSKVNPTLRAVPTYCPELFSEINPNTSGDKLDEILYKYKGKTELAIKKQSDKILKTQAASLNEIKEEVDEISKKITDFQKDQLASYIIFRRKTIDLLNKKIELNPEGKFYNENIIHDILFPQYACSDYILYENHNLWFLDERLTFHSYAKSEHIYSKNENDNIMARADIVIYGEINEDKTARCVTIIELKKPERVNFDSNPIEQINTYIRKAKTNELKMKNGRTLHTDENTRYYCYAICDINQTIKDFADGAGYRKIPGDRGYYNYNPIYNAHMEIVDFDKIVSDAIIRHKVFFEKLGL